MAVSLDVGVWIAALFTIAAVSIAFKDNLMFKFAEHTFVGAAAGHAIVYGVKSFNDLGVLSVMKGQVWYLIPMILGLLLYTQYSKKYSWLARYGVTILVGIGVGVSMRAMIQTQFTDQIVATARPLLVANSALETINRILMVIIVCGTIFHFIYTIKPVYESTITRWVTPVGRYAMMIAFGAAVGSTILTGLGMFSGRIAFLLYQWLGLG